MPEQKPDRDCDDWENASLTKSIIVSIEEEKALGLKFDNKKFDKSVPFSCFSTETEQETMKEVQETSTVENTSLESVKTILNKVVDERADNRDHFFLLMQLKQYLKKLPSNVSNRRIVYKRQSREGLLLSITLREREVESQKLLRTKKNVSSIEQIETTY